MDKDAVDVENEDSVLEESALREDTVKSYRGVMWALISVAGFALIAAILFFVFFSASVADDAPADGPVEVERERNK